MKGILFKEDMIKAIVNGSKSQTRRVIKPQPSCGCEQRHIARFKDGSVNFFYEHHNTPIRYKPRYQVGEVVYIKEAWRIVSFSDDFSQALVYYKDGQDWRNVIQNLEFYYYNRFIEGKYHDWRSPLFMPAWAARYFIQITDVRAERLQEITEDDAIAEGILSDPTIAVYEYSRVWDSINPKYPWGSNPWCFVYSFKEIKK